MALLQEGSRASELVAHYAQSVKGKTILTTGVTPGSIGAAYVEALAGASPALLILVGRSVDKLEKEAAVIASEHPEIPTRNLVADLGSFESVRKAAAEVNSWKDVEKIDIVMNSAGIMATPYRLSVDGYESQFATNHLGHFLLTNLIMDKILASDAPRVVNFTSDGHRLGFMRWADLNFDGGKAYDKWFAYGQSKTANMLMAVSLAEKLGKRNLLAYSVHPGVVLTSNLSGHLDLSAGLDNSDDYISCVEAHRRMGNDDGFNDKLLEKMPLDSAQGAATSVFASFDPELKEHNGKYLTKCQVQDPMTDAIRTWATNPIDAERLWRLSEDIVGQKFSY